MIKGNSSPEGVRKTPPPARKSLTLRERVIPSLLSIISVVVFFGIAAYFITRSEQWPRIKLQFFNIEAIKESFPNVARGFLVNMRVWIISLVAIAIWALVLAIFRSLDGPWFAPLRVFTVVYIDLFSGLGP